MATLFQKLALSDKTGKEYKAGEVLKDKVVALLFAASWCPASRDFLKPLNKLHTDLKKRLAPFEIVFVSMDKTKEAMEEFFRNEHGDWLALTHQHTFGDTLLEKYEITAIPKLVVIKDSGDVVSHKGRKDIQEKGSTCFRLWAAGANIADWERLAVLERKKREEKQNTGETSGEAG